MGNIQGTLQEHFEGRSRNISGIFGEHFMNVQGKFGKYFKNIRGTFGEHFKNVLEAFGENKPKPWLHQKPKKT
jgi:hypothetical protein